MWGQAVVNMAAAAGRALSFSRNAKVLVSPIRSASALIPLNAAEVSKYREEPVTHTGQVRLQIFYLFLTIMIVAPLSDSFSFSRMSEVQRCFLICIFLLMHFMITVSKSYLSSVYDFSFFSPFQLFDANDIRRVRFIGTQKEVNMRSSKEN